jgi:excisionase family DNA binding protein
VSRIAEPSVTVEPGDRVRRLLEAASELSDTIARTERLTQRSAAALSATTLGSYGSLSKPPRHDASEGWLTLEQAATRTNRHPDLLRRWCATGRVKATRIGRHWLLEEADLAAVASLPTRQRRLLSRPTTKRDR